MIMMGDKKKAMTAILGPAHEEEPQESPNELHAISKELIDGVKSDDHEAVANCLSAAWELMGSKDDQVEE